MTKQNLYKVTLRGLTFSTTGTVYGVSYVVATDPTEAYNKVRKFLNEKFTGHYHMKPTFFKTREGANFIIKKQKNFKKNLIQLIKEIESLN